MSSRLKRELSVGAVVAAALGGGYWQAERTPPRPRIRPQWALPSGADEPA